MIKGKYCHECGCETMVPVVRNGGLWWKCEKEMCGKIRPFTLSELQGIVAQEYGYFGLEEHRYPWEKSK